MLLERRRLGLNVYSMIRSAAVREVPEAMSAQEIRLSSGDVTFVRGPARRGAPFSHSALSQDRSIRGAGASDLLGCGLVKITLVGAGQR
jgi:hypothetical protein